MMGFDWFPSFSKEVFSDIIKKYQLKLFDESAGNIAFENEFVYWGMHIDDYYYVRSGFYFDKKNTQKRLDMTQLLEHESTEIKEYFYNRMQEIFSGEYWKHAEEIIKSYFLHFFEGKIPDYWEQAINEPRHDYHKRFKDR